MLSILVAIIIISIRLYKRNWQDQASCTWPFVWGFLTFIVIIVAFVIFVVASNLLVNNLFLKPSRVDASPIATISEDNFYRFDEALAQMVAQGYIREFASEHPSIHYQSERVSHPNGTQWISRTRFTSNFSPSRLSIIFYIHPTAERAASWVQSSGRLNPQHVYVQNDNNTDVLMLYPWMPVSAGGWHIPSNIRSTRTEIRIGNIVIYLRENQHWGTVRNDYTSQFIAALVEAMHNKVDTE